MEFSTARSERITAIVSTIVAVAILAGGVTAYQSHNKPVEDVIQLESDFRFQLEVGFRHDPNERAARLEVLQQVTDAWQQSPRRSADREKLASWLLEATIRSMPGSIEALPATPEFGTVEPAPQRVDPTSNMPRPDVVVQPPLVQIPAKPSVPTPTPTLAPAPVVAPTLATPRKEAVVATPVEPPQTDVAAVEIVQPPHPTPIQPTTTQPQPVQASLVSVAPAPVGINIPELRARITGYHLGLDEIENSLGRADADEFAVLGELVRQLAALSHDYRFIKLYYDTLNDQERRAVAAPRAWTSTLAKLQQRLDRSQAMHSGDFLEEFETSRQENVGRLRQQLQSLTASAGR